MANVCTTIDDKGTLSPELVTVRPLEELEGQRVSLRPAQKLRWPAPQPEILTPFLSKVATYLTGAIFLVGIAVAFLFAVDAGNGFPVSFLSQAHGPLVDKFVLGRDNLAMVVFDVTIMAAAICFLFVLPDMHWRSRRYLETPLISPGRARKIKWGNYGGVVGLILGMGGSFASRFAPAESTLRIIGTPDLLSLGLAPKGYTYQFVGPLDLAFIGFAACAICYGLLGLAGASFVPRKVAKWMVTYGVVTGILVTIIIFLPIPPAVLTFLYWGLFLGTVAWMVPFNQAYVNSWKDPVPEDAELSGIDASIQKTLWVLGITSRQQLASEDSEELGAILGVPASLVDQWKGGTSQAPKILCPALACYGNAMK